MSKQDVLAVSAVQDVETIKGLASDLRVRILAMVLDQPMNVSQLAEVLKMPQSTIATNVQALEKVGLIDTKTVRARKGSQKICRAVYREILIQFPQAERQQDDTIEVEMPIGLYTSHEASPPCGLCSTQGIIGFLDVPDAFLSPERMKAGLLWFEKGYIEYKFPNNSLYKDRIVRKVELIAELSSETPGTNRNWLSDITVWINDKEIGLWTSPGDFGEKRGKLTPAWWKLEGSQYGLLKHWAVTDDGSFVDGVRVSGVKVKDLNLALHHSIRVRIGVKETAEHLGGLNLFGRGFGNYDQDVILRLHFD